MLRSYAAIHVELAKGHQMPVRWLGMVYPKSRRARKPLSLNEVSVFLVRARRRIREVLHVTDRARDEARCIRRRCRLLEQADASDCYAARMTELQARVARCEDIVVEAGQELERLGRTLICLAPMIDVSATFAQRCDLLNVSVADRHALVSTDGFIRIAFVWGFEDSAGQRRSTPWANGPLRRAMFQAYRNGSTHMPLISAVQNKWLSDREWSASNLRAMLGASASASDLSPGVTFRHKGAGYFRHIGASRSG